MARNNNEKKAEENNDDGVEIQEPEEVPWYRQLLAIKDTIIIILTPIVFPPLFLASTTRVRIYLCYA